MKWISFATALFIILYITPLFAQVRPTYVIKGQVKDSITRKPIAEGLIVISNARSSKNLSTDKNGSFSATSQPGNMTIVISQYGYHNKYLQVLVRDSITDLGIIQLRSLSINLNEFTVKGQPVIAKVSKDTTEFNSSSFEVNENALLEELLKNLPGLEISSDGSISYNGEKIEKILIDGQEYFGSNILMALKNISADLIDKLQIITSDNQGMGVGNNIEKVKVLNLTIKESQRDKFSGNIQLGYGSSDKYIGSLTLNRFSSQKQLSIIANMDNINGIQDGKPKISSGFNKSSEIGLNYNYIINPKNNLSTNVLYSGLSGYNTSATRREFINTTPSGLSLQNNETNANTKSINIDIKHQLKMDSLNQVTQRISFKNTNRTTTNSSNYSNQFPSSSIDITGRAYNKSLSNNTSISYSNEFIHRINNSKGAFSQTINAGINNSRDKMDYLSDYKQKYDDSTVSTLLDNYNPISGRTTNISGITGLAYLFNSTLSLFGLNSISYISSIDKNQVYARDPVTQGKMSLIDSLNNDWNYKLIQNSLTMGLNVRSKKFDGSIYANWQIRQQEVLPTNSSVAEINWNYIYPRIDLTYRFKPSSTLAYSLYYDAAAISPALLITTRNFQNPLIVQSGNSALKNPIKRNMTVRFSNLNPKTLSNFSSTVMFSNTNQKIVQNTFFDSLGRQILTPINLDHSRMLSWGTTYSKPFFKRRLAINLSNNVLYANDPVSVSGILGTSESLSITPRVSINYTKKELIDIQSSFSANRTYSTYNLGTVTKNEVTSFNMNLEVTGYLPLGFIAGVKYNKVVTSGLSAGFNRSVDLLNVFLSKRLLKNKMEIKAQGFDILNNNNSFSRTFTPTYFEDTQSTVLQRFFMGSIVYYIK